MRLAYMVWREISRRKAGFVAGVTAATIAAGALTGGLTAMRAHDARTKRILDSRRDDLERRLAELDTDIERAMRHLGYAFSVVPADRNLSDWYATDYASAFLAQTAADRLARDASLGRLALLPRIRQKVKWPERRLTVLLVGQGEPCGNIPPPGTTAVADGQCVLGHELHASLDLRRGQSLQFMSNTFAIAGCQPETGSKDDVTVTLSLADAQRLLEKRDAISEILLYQPGPTVESIAELRRRIPELVPGGRLLGNASHLNASLAARRDVARDGRKAIAEERENREALRRRRRRLLALVASVSLLVSVAWLFLLAHANVRRRSEEIGILRTLGYSTSQVMWLLLCRGIATGVIGGGAGALVAVAIQAAANSRGGADLHVIALAFATAILASLVGGGIPAWLGAQMDPAERLRGL